MFSSCGSSVRLNRSRDSSAGGSSIGNGYVGLHGFICSRGASRFGSSNASQANNQKSNGGDSEGGRNSSIVSRVAAASAAAAAGWRNERRDVCYPAAAAVNGPSLADVGRPMSWFAVNEAGTLTISHSPNPYVAATVAFAASNAAYRSDSGGDSLSGVASVCVELSEEDVPPLLPSLLRAAAAAAAAPAVGEMGRRREGVVEQGGWGVERAVVAVRWSV